MANNQAKIEIENYEKARRAYQQHLENDIRKKVSALDPEKVIALYKIVVSNELPKSAPSSDAIKIPSHYSARRRKATIEMRTSVLENAITNSLFVNKFGSETFKILDEKKIDLAITVALKKRNVVVQLKEYSANEIPPTMSEYHNYLKNIIKTEIEKIPDKKTLNSLYTFLTGNNAPENIPVNILHRNIIWYLTLSQDLDGHSVVHMMDITEEELAKNLKNTSLLEAFKLIKEVNVHKPEIEEILFLENAKKKSKEQLSAMVRKITGNALEKLYKHFKLPPLEPTAPDSDFQNNIVKHLIETHPNNSNGICLALKKLHDEYQDASGIENHFSIPVKLAELQVLLDRYAKSIKSFLPQLEENTAAIRITQFDQLLKTNKDLLGKRRDHAFVTFIKALSVVAGTIFGIVGGVFAYNSFFGQNRTHGLLFMNKVADIHRDSQVENKKKP